MSSFLLETALVFCRRGNGAVGGKGSLDSREVASKQYKAQVNKYHFYVFSPHFIGWFGWILACKVAFDDLSMYLPAIFFLLYSFTMPRL